REWRDIETASSARVTKDRAGRWFVSFTRLAPQIEREPTGEIVGMDMGVTHTVATSKGKFLDMKLLTNRERQLQRKLARQTKGSNRRNATKLAIAKLSAKGTDRRKDWIEWTTT
uniref:transposase n=1 Tax=Ferrimicrobium acidiphilum TaxID=121039 RepID=UPI0023F4E539